ncbi:hypothetical protein [Cytobacillus kochii]
MSFINPLFEPSKNEKQKPNVSLNQKQTKSKKRSTRNDKTHNIKFPISSIQQIKLRSYCKQAQRVYQEKELDPLPQTKFNTKLLRYGMNHPEILTWSHNYKDSKTYMHTNLLETEYQDIGGPHGYAIRENLSERKVVYQIIMSVIVWMEGGGSLEKIL